MACEVVHRPNPSEEPKFWCHAILAAVLLKNTFRHYRCKCRYDRGIESLDLQTQLGVPTNLTDLDKLGRLNLVGNLGRLPKMACAGMIAQLLTTLSSGLVRSHEDKPILA